MDDLGVPLFMETPVCVCVCVYVCVCECEKMYIISVYQPGASDKSRYLLLLLNPHSRPFQTRHLGLRHLHIPIVLSYGSLVTLGTRYRRHEPRSGCTGSSACI